MGGSAYIGTRIGAPGMIEHTGTMARLRFGPVLPAQRPAAEAFFAACKKAGINAELTDDITLVNWEKFAFLVGLSSGTTALSRSPLGVVRADPDLRWMFEQAMRETWTLARARGVRLLGRFRREAARVPRHPARRDAGVDAARPGGGQPPGSAVAVRRRGAHGRRERAARRR